MITAPLALVLSGLAAAGPVLHQREVTAIDPDAFAQAHQRDDSATRAFSDVNIRTSDGRCLYIDMLSGDDAANGNPIQVADCGSTDGQAFDVITSGEHNNRPNDKKAIIVSTLTHGCFHFNSAQGRVQTFSCGGRANGSGRTSRAQLFNFKGSAGPRQLSPKNAGGRCMVVTEEDVVGIADCDTTDPNQFFTFGDQPNCPGPLVTTVTEAPITVTATTTETEIPDTVTVISTETAPVPTEPPLEIAQPTDETTPVSRAGHFFDPEGAAASHMRDDEAERAFSGVQLQASNGDCLFIDPTAGNSRQNLIPIAFNECHATGNQLFDIITEGVHNDDEHGHVLIVSSLMNGCISFDGRRAEGDRAIIFSCGGRAAGTGETNHGQLFTINQSDGTVTLSPMSNHDVCIVPGLERLVPGECGMDDSVYTIIVSEVPTQPEGEE